MDNVIRSCPQAIHKLSTMVQNANRFKRYERVPSNERGVGSMSRDDWDEGVIEGVQGDSVDEPNAASRNVADPGIRREVLEMIEGTKERKRIDGKPIGVKTDAPRITPKMRAFASLVAQGNSPREAYRKAYAVRSDTAESTVMASANKLMKDQRISGLMEPIWESVKQNVIDDAIATRRHVLEQLHAHASNTEARASDRLKALELMGKAIGMFVDKSEQKVEQVDPEQLKRELDSHLKAFKLRAV